MSDFPKRGLITPGAIDLSRSVRVLLWREDPVCVNRHAGKDSVTGSNRRHRCPTSS